MQTGLFILGALLVWFVLNKWILPKLGVATRMSASCGTGSSTEHTKKDSKHKGVDESNAS